MFLCPPITPPVRVEGLGAPQSASCAGAWDGVRGKHPHSHPFIHPPCPEVPRGASPCAGLLDLREGSRPRPSLKELTNTDTTLGPRHSWGQRVAGRGALTPGWGGIRTGFTENTAAVQGLEGHVGISRRRSACSCSPPAPRPCHRQGASAISIRSAVTFLMSWAGGIGQCPAWPPSPSRDSRPMLSWPLEVSGLSRACGIHQPVSRWCEPTRCPQNLGQMLLL